MVSEDRLQAIDVIPQVSEIIEKAKKVLEKYSKEVKFAFLFGSYARGEADRWSDVDIGIYFSKGFSDEEKTGLVFRLLMHWNPYRFILAILMMEMYLPLYLLRHQRVYPL